MINTPVTRSGARTLGRAGQTLQPSWSLRLGVGRSDWTSGVAAPKCPTQSLALALGTLLPRGGGKLAVPPDPGAGARGEGACLGTAQGQSPDLS